MPDIYEERYVVEDGIRRGPFKYSAEWANLNDVKNVEKHIFGDKMLKWAKWLKARAFNKSYTPPENPLHMARDTIYALRDESDKYKKLMIEANKELSILKRQIGKVKDLLDNSEDPHYDQLEEISSILFPEKDTD